MSCGNPVVVVAINMTMAPALPSLQLWIATYCEQVALQTGPPIVWRRSTSAKSKPRGKTTMNVYQREKGSPENPFLYVLSVYHREKQATA